MLDFNMKFHGCIDSHVIIRKMSCTRTITLQFFSSPEPNVLMVSFCDCLLSVQRRKHLPCLHTRVDISCPIFMKVDQKICPNNILDEFKQCSGWLKTWSPRGRAFFTNMAIVKPFYHSRGNTYCPIFLKLCQNISISWIQLISKHGSQGRVIFPYMA